VGNRVDGLVSWNWRRVPLTIYPVPE